MIVKIIDRMHDKFADGCKSAMMSASDWVTIRDYIRTMELEKKQCRQDVADLKRQLAQMEDVISKGATT